MGLDMISAISTDVASTAKKSISKPKIVKKHKIEPGSDENQAKENLE